MAAKKVGGWLGALQKTGLTVTSASDALQVKGWLDTGNYALNWALSGRLLGGYPLGHTGEMFGDPGTGKSFLAARAMAMAQKQGGVCLLDDSEGAYNKEHTAHLGVDVDALAYTHSRTVKEHLVTANAFVKAYKEAKPKGPGVLVLDSLALLSTEHEMATQLDKKDMSKAAELKAFYRIMLHDLTDLTVAHIATNHTIAAIGSYGNARTTGGGGGPKFAATWRLDLRAISKIRRGTGEGSEVTGTICRVVVDKNRIVAPWKEVRLAIPFNQPISRASGLIPLLVAMDVLEEQGNFLYHQGQKLGRSYKTKERFLAQDEQAEAILDQFPELLEEADALIAAGAGKALKAADAREDDAEEGDDESGED